MPGHKDHKEKGRGEDQHAQAAALAQDAGARGGAVDARHEELTELHLNGGPRGGPRCLFGVTGG